MLYGRCDEDLGVPYQPWAQALEHLVREAPQTDPRRPCRAIRRRHRAPGARPCAIACPTCRPPHQSDPETERYLLYAAAAGLLEGAGSEEPVLLILDDLQWADQPTLSLLRHVRCGGRFDAGDGHGRSTASPISPATIR